METLDSRAPDRPDALWYASRRRSALDEDRLRRITRLLKILSLLQSGRPHGLRDLSEACCCSTKTIQRDLSYWRELGIPIDYDTERHTYVMIGDPPFKLLDLGVVEATSLAIAEVAAGAARGLTLDRSITEAFEKIHSLVPRNVAERLESCREALLAGDGAKRDYSRAPLMPLLEACRRRLTVVVDYDSHSSGRRDRRIEPYHIAFLEGFWIVIARDPARGEVRNFALDRIHSVREPIPPVPFRIPAGWSVTEYLAGSVGVLRGERTDISLRFEREAVRWLSGRRWRFPATLSAPDANGAVTLTGTVAGLDEITGEVLRWGKHVTVLAPEALRDRIAAEARAIAAKYPAPNGK